MKKFLMVLFAVATITAVALLGATSASAETSGTTGDCTWTLDDGVLTISGNGRMWYSSWENYLPYITEVIIEDGVTNIMDYAFEGCTKLTQIIIPDSVNEIGYSAFAYCSSLINITIPNSVTIIESKAFKGSNLKSITIPNSVTCLGDSVFEDCVNLTDANLFVNETWINEYMFSGCTSLERILLPEGVNVIGSQAFSGCRSLTKITIPNSVTSIGERAFASCASLESIIIPDNVTNIDETAFRGCFGVNQIVVSQKNSTYYSEGNCLILKGVKALIRGCHNSVVPNDITYIGSYAFDACKDLRSITIPESVTSIGWEAFDGCSAMERVIILSPKIAEELSSFDSCGELLSGVESVYIDASIGNVGSYITDKYLCKTEGISYKDAICVVYNRTHNYSNVWQYDSKGHYHACEKCGESTNIERHTDDEINGACDVCGYVCHHIIPTDDWQTDMSAHWQKCSVCGMIKNYENHHGNYPCDTVCNTCGTGIGDNSLPHDYILKTTLDDHWYECSVCENITDKDKHRYYGSTCADDTCYICGYVRKTTHAFDEDWFYDAEYHFRMCDICGFDKDKGVHISGAPATETTPQVCTVCGYIIRSALGHKCQFDTSWSTNYFTHWHACSGCGERKDVGDHVYHNACDTTCNTCGYTRTISHTYKTTWETNNTQHWHICSVCGVSDEKVAHLFVNDLDATCDICGYVREVVTTSLPTTEPEESSALDTDDVDVTESSSADGASEPEASDADGTISSAPIPTDTSTPVTTDPEATTAPDTTDAPASDNENGTILLVAILAAVGGAGIAVGTVLLLRRKK